MVNKNLNSKKRIYVVRSSYEINLESLLHMKSFEDIKTHLDKCQSEMPESHFEYKVEYYGYDGGCSVYLIRYSIETDEEYTSRIRILEEHEAKEKIRKEKAELIKKEKQAKKELEERELYEQLKKKFES